MYNATLGTRGPREVGEREREGRTSGHTSSESHFHAKLCKCKITNRFDKDLVYFYFHVVQSSEEKCQVAA